MAAADKTVPADAESLPARPAGEARTSGPMLDARCPRCGGGFECGAQAGHCACFGIHLTESLRTELAGRYGGCLCLPCLRELTGAAKVSG